MNYMGRYSKFSRQAIRFGITGLVSNFVLYLFYLCFTKIGVGHKTAMSLLFAAGALQTFAFNKLWTFNYQGLSRSLFIKYVFIYSSAYLLNLAMLLRFVDHLGYPHHIVQGITIFIIGAILFFLQKCWVFRVSVPGKS